MLVSNAELREKLDVRQDMKLIKWLNDNRIRWTRDAKRPARFERATAWFVARPTLPKYQPVRPHSYGRFRGFAGILSNTCAGLWG